MWGGSYGRLTGGGTGRGQGGIRLGPSRESPDARPGRRLREPKVRALRRQIGRSYPKSTPHLRVDFLRILFNDAINACGLLTQMLQLAHMLQPRLLACFGIGCQLVLDGFGHKLTEWNPALRRDRLGAAKDGIGNL